MRTFCVATRAAAVVLVAAGLAIAAPAQALAAATDYRFELVGSPVKSGKVTLIKVRLVHVPDAKPMPGAIIIQTKLDMAPQGGMAGMTAPATVSTAPEPGIYQVTVEPQIGGDWTLSLSAKVQGERDTVSGTVTVPIAK